MLAFSRETISALTRCANAARTALCYGADKPEIVADAALSMIGLVDPDAAQEIARLRERYGPRAVVREAAQFIQIF